MYVTCEKQTLNYEKNENSSVVILVDLLVTFPFVMETNITPSINVFTFDCPKDTDRQMNRHTDKPMKEEKPALNGSHSV